LADDRIAGESLEAEIVSGDPPLIVVPEPVTVKVTFAAPVAAEDGEAPRDGPLLTVIEIEEDL